MDHVRDRRDRCVRNASLVHFDQTIRESLRPLRKSDRRAKSGRPRPQNDNSPHGQAFSQALFRLIGYAMIGAMLAAGPLSAHSAAPQAASSQTASGADVYQARCAQCHENGAATRAPSRDTLQKMPASRILRTLDFGLMMGVAYPLTREERNAVANYLGPPRPPPLPPATAFCSADRHGLSGEAAGNWNGWSPSPAHPRDP